MMRLISAAFLALFLPGLASGASPDWASSTTKVTARQIVEKMLLTQAKLGAYSCTVVREERSETDVHAEPRRVTGTLKAKPQGKARFETEGASQQLVISDGKTLWMVLPEARQAIRQDAASLKTSGQFFLDLATSIRYYARTSKVRMVDPGPEWDPKATSALELLPKDPSAAGFDRVKVWVDHKRWLAQKSELYGAGLVVSARFLDIQAPTLAEVKANPKKALPDSLFAFQPPAGWEVFDSLLP
jgi:outer membrane lipoprotein-sorting protein